MKRINSRENEHPAFLLIGTPILPFATDFEKGPSLGELCERVAHNMDIYFKDQDLTFSGQLNKCWTENLDAYHNMANE